MDASGLELAVLRITWRDMTEEFMEQVVEGDIHTVNQQAAGLPTRQDAKRFIYAFLYGAGDEKIGAITGGGRRKATGLEKNSSKESLL